MYTIVVILLEVSIVDAETVSNTLKIGSSNYANTPLKFLETFHVKKTVGGKYVYCQLI